MLREFPVPQEPSLSSDLYELNAEHFLPPFAQNRLVVGATYRRNIMRSNVYLSDRIAQNQWAVFLENAWGPVGSFSWVASARLDRHPLTGWVFSPRGSLIFSPAASQVFRLSAGTSFRNPSLTESYLAFAGDFETPLPVPVTLEVGGSPDLSPERMVQIEAAYTGRFGRLKASAVGFHYRLKDMIWLGRVKLVTEALPELRVRASSINDEAEIQAWGGELGAEVEVNRQAAVFGNYSFQRQQKTPDEGPAGNRPPAHKANGGVRFRGGGLTAGLWAHWVDRTYWSDVSLEVLTTQALRVDGYLLFNAHVGYRFSGRRKGVSVAVSAFNLLDHRHFQIIPERSETEPGQGGEVVRRRVTGTVSYRF